MTWTIIIDFISRINIALETEDGVLITEDSHYACGTFIRDDNISISEQVWTFCR